MSLPEWGSSYNALYVPLKGSWQCALVPARDIEDVDRGWRLSYDERQKARKAREDQMAQDRRDFDQLFRVSIARRSARVSGDFSAYADFIGKHVRGRWHKPIDGDDITRILREAVRDGLIVPVIDRDWRGSVGVSKRYAPQTWSETYRSGGSGAVAAASPRGKTFHESVMESMGLMPTARRPTSKSTTRWSSASTQSRRRTLHGALPLRRPAMTTTCSVEWRRQPGPCSAAVTIRRMAMTCSVQSLAVARRRSVTRSHSTINRIYRMATPKNWQPATGAPETTRRKTSNSDLWSRPSV